MTPPGRGPGRGRRAAALGTASAAALAATLTGAAFLAVPVAASPVTTTTVPPWVAGVNGTMTVGIDEAPTGCNPNTVSGDTWADRLVLEPVLPSAFDVNSSGDAVYDSALITQAELQSTSPETIVYTINPKAVWSDGKPVTAADFVYTWEQERGSSGTVGAKTPPSTPASPTAPGTTGAPGTTTTTTAPSTTTTTGASGSTTTGSGGSTGASGSTTTPTGTATTLPGATGTTGPAMGYRQIKSMTPSNHGRAVTVVFKTPYVDWQSLFDYLLPANVLEKSGWDPSCTTVDPSIDLSAGPFMIGKVVPGKEIVLERNPRWWQSQPPLARIDIRIAESPAQLAQWLADGTVDVALPAGYDQSYLESVTSQPSVSTQLQVSTTFLELEMSTTSTATASADVRQAIAHAIDRQALVDDTVGWANTSIVPSESFLAAQPQSGYTPHKPPPLQVSGVPGYTPSSSSSTKPGTTTFPVTADLPLTAKLLTGLDYFRDAEGRWAMPDGRLLTLRLVVDAADSWAVSAAPEIVHDLDAAGISVTETTEPTASATGAALSAGGADLALLPLRSSPYLSQSIAWYTTLLGPPGTGGSQDWSNLADPTLDGLLEKASQDLNPDDATPVYTQADALLWQEMPGLPLFAEPSLTAWSGVTDGVSANANGPSLFWSAQSWAMRVPPTSKDTGTS
ncbi:MAG: ABC transporter substrate-binding protein [Acidimicrobiales bacterium]